MLGKRQTHTGSFTERDYVIGESGVTSSKDSEKTKERDILIGWVLWNINHCRLFNAKSCLYNYIRYVICEHIL